MKFGYSDVINGIISAFAFGFFARVAGFSSEQSIYLGIILGALWAYVARDEEN